MHTHSTPSKDDFDVERAYYSLPTFNCCGAIRTSIDMFVLQIKRYCTDDTRLCVLSSNIAVAIRID
eukprot:scaffold10163_cov270-Chaetoceros_neogracile.AAC.55